MGVESHRLHAHAKLMIMRLHERSDSPNVHETHEIRPRTCRWRDPNPNERKRRVRHEIGEEHEEPEEEHEAKEDDARCPRRGELEEEETALMEATWHIKTIPATR